MELGVGSRVCVAVPVRNGRGFLADSLRSLLAQAGDFRLRVHIQDGGSTDGTVDLVREWAGDGQAVRWLTACQEVTVTWASEPDRGMYDAINRAFAAMEVADGDILAWLNSDDLLMPGAVEFARARMAQFAEVHWLTGRPCEADETGVVRRIHAPQVFHRELLGAGLHDGRRLPFVMQEGSFWRGWLWRKAGGLNGGLRLAGDYDLWRRFAREAALESTEMVLAVHRRHGGQLSAAVDRYQEEMEGVLDAAERERRDRLWEEYQRWQAGERGGVTYAGPMVVFNPAAGAWERVERGLPGPGTPLLAVMPDGTRREMARCTPGAGFTALEGPYPHLGLAETFRFAPRGRSVVGVEAAEAGAHWLLVRYRNFTPGLTVRAGSGEAREAPVTGHERNGVLVMEVELRGGREELSLEVEAPAGDAGPGLLVMGMDVMAAGARGWRGWWRGLRG